MRSSYRTLLLATLGGSFLWHVLAMIFLSSVVVVTVGNPEAGYRKVDFTSLDFAYELVNSAPPITTHFEPPKIPSVVDRPEATLLETIPGDRKLFDSGFVPKKKDPLDQEEKVDLAPPPKAILPKKSVAPPSSSHSDIEVRSGIYDDKGKSVSRSVIYKPSIPNYPLWAEVQGREFNARFSLAVSSGGRVMRVRILSSSGSGDIDRVSMTYLRKWKFAIIPAQRGVKNYTIPVDFILDR